MERLATFQARFQASPAYETVQRACAEIRARLKSRKAYSTRTLGQERAAWAKEFETKQGDRSRKKLLEDIWRERWNRGAAPQEGTSPRPGRYTVLELIRRPPGRTVLALHKNLRKAESSALVQFRTGRTGLAGFLHKVGVPNFPSPACKCSWREETPYHVLRDCPLEDGRRSKLRTICDGGIDVVRLLDTPEGASITARWIVQSGRLPQFNLAKAISYE